MASLNSYAKPGLRAKQTFVEQALRKFRPKRLLDVGSNLGDYGEMAARLDCGVVAVDSDQVVSGQLWRRARSEKLNILPLVVDFARPSPAVGWRNQESTSFLERARGQSMDAERLLLTFEDNHTALWGEQTNLFSMVAGTRRRVGVAGWYHPYCRVLTDSLAQCSWEGSLPEECFNESNLLRGSANIVRRLQALLTLDEYLGMAQTVPFLAEDVKETRQIQLESYNKILHASLTMAADPMLGLIFVHWPIPHPFGI